MSSAVQLGDYVLVARRGEAEGSLHKVTGTGGGLELQDQVYHDLKWVTTREIMTGEYTVRRAPNESSRDM